MAQNTRSEDSNVDFSTQRLRIAIVWLLMLGALFTVFVWVGDIADTRASEPESSTTSKIWSEIANGKSVSGAMHDMGFSVKKDETPDWLQEVCSLDVLDRAYIDNGSGIVGIALNENLSDACEIMRKEFFTKGWIEVAADEENVGCRSSQLSDDSLEPSFADNEHEGYILSFMKDKGITRWITMECAESAKGTSIVLHTERI